MANTSAAIDSLQVLVQKQMGAFQARLDAASGAPTDLGALRAEFQNFQAAIWEAIDLLRRQSEQTERRLDELEAHSRRKVLLLHGVEEREGEVAAAVVCRLCEERLGLAGITPADLDACHRLGRQKPDAAQKRPILVRFARMNSRNGVWSAKKKLKGSGVTLSEFLTAARRKIFGEARKCFGVSRSWTRDGAVYVQSASGSAVRVASEGQLRQLAAAAQAAAAAAAGPAANADDGKKRQRPPPRSCVSKPK